MAASHTLHALTLPPPAGIVHGMTPLEHNLSCLTVRLGAVRENYRNCLQLAGSAKTAAVVKADAYGLGMAPIVGALLEERNDTFFVANLTEAVTLRSFAPRARIFVLDGVQPETATALMSQNVIPVLNSLVQIRTWSEAAQASRATLDAAIHIDTGMNRLGLPGSELSTLAAESATWLKNVNLALLMSQLACGDNWNSAENALQLDRFRAALAALPPAPASLSSSAGIMLGREYVFDMVRPGIALYGGNPQPENPNPFKVVAKLTGQVLQLRRVDKGESVGYGASFRTERPTMLATVALGYADGLMRAIGNRGVGAIAGVTVPIAGRLSMDLTTLDVTDAPAAAVFIGANVEFLGDTISLESLADAAGSASYEVLTSLRGRVARRYVEGA